MNIFHLRFLSACIGLACTASGYASTVRNDIPYLTFRDFAENRGLFQPGALDIPIYDNSGKLVGRLDKAPMADFSSVDTSGIATLVNPQYIVSVKHNGGYKSVRFGGEGNNPDKNFYNYSIVDRNNSASLDFHAPRLNKLVTEVVPTAITAQGAMNNAYLNTTRYPAFYRVGSGNQYVQDKDGNQVKVSGAYQYLTGGTVGAPGSYQNGQMVSSGTGALFSPNQGPLATRGEGGDSGSPLFAWDTVLSKWVLVGVMTTANKRGNNWAVIPQPYLESTINEDTDPAVVVNASGSPVLWTYDSATGTGTLQQGSQKSAMHGQKGSDLNAGKNLTFTGASGKILLENTVSQGAGALTFTGDYVVSSRNNSLWSGAGIIVDDKATVTWQVHGEANDALHKLGAGTLYVNGTGINKGNLRVGDGTVILAQKAGAAGNTQAFKEITLTSGRPTVVLSDSKQINPDNIYFGYRGGRLDLNGNDITMARLKAADSGARVVNHNAGKAATLTLNGTGINNINNLQSFMGFLGESDRSLTNGELNVHYNSPYKYGVLALTGGANVKGTLFADRGIILLSGAPVLHADNVYGDDWTPSRFTFSTIQVAQDAGLQIGQYATVFSDISAGKNSRVEVGYHYGGNSISNTRKCTVDDNSGVVRCSTPQLTTEELAALPATSLTGTISLADSATLTLGKTRYTGAINAATTSITNMDPDSHWQMAADSTLGSLNMSKGATITLSGPARAVSDSTLTIHGDLHGEGQFALHSQLAGQRSDRIIVNGLASGYFTLSVQDDGGDPLQDGKMHPLLSLTNSAQDFSAVNVGLSGGYADIGSYRYRLNREGSSYVLYNPLVPSQPIEPSKPATPDKPPVQPDKPPVQPDNPPVQPDDPPVQPDNPPVQPDNPPVQPAPALPDNSQANWISHGANTAVSYFTSHFNVLSQQGESTERYLRNLAPEQAGMWMTYRANDLRFASSSYRSYQQKLTNQALGADWLLRTTSGALQWGGVLTSTYAHASFDEGARGEDQAQGINLYGKFTFHSGFWLSGYSGVHYLSYRLEDTTTIGRSGMFGFITGLGAGYRWQTADGLQLQPEVGITASRLPSGRYSLEQNIRVSEEASQIMQYHLGLQTSKTTSLSGIEMTPFAQVIYRKNRHTGSTIKVNNQTLDAPISRYQTELSAGIQISPTASVKLNVQGGYITGGGLKDTKDLSLGLRYEF